MILRASAKFQRHYRKNAEKIELPVQSFPQTLNLDLLPYGRSQLIVLASEEHSPFSFFIPMSRSSDFGLFLTAFQGRLKSWMDNIRLFKQPDTAGYQFTRRTDQRIIGSQNDFLSVTKKMLLDFDKPITPENLEKIEREINSMPMSYLGMDSPDRAFWRYKAS